MQTMVVKLLVNAPSVSSKRDLKLSGYQESKSCQVLNDLLLLTRNPAKFKLATKRYNAPEGFNTLYFQAACSSLSNIKQMDQLVEGIFSSFITADSD